MRVRGDPPTAARWQRARHLLCVRLDGMGDVLMCTPALRALRAAMPGRRLTLLTSPAAALVAPHVPELDAVLAYAAPWMKPSPAAGEDRALLRRLRAARYDGAIIFTSFSQSPLPAALLCHQAGIPLRLAHCRENPYHLLTDWLTEPEPAQCLRHEVRRQLDLVAAIGCAAADTRLSFEVDAAAQAAVRRRLTALGMAPDARWLLLHPGASAASRRYPAAHWAAVIRGLREHTGLPLVLAGGSGERALVNEIQGASGEPVQVMAGDLPLGELGAALRQAAVAICNNSGPAHMAAALGTPLVALYAMTNPQHTPWQVPNRLLYHDVPCRFCFQSQCPQGHHHCLQQIAPARVVQAVCELLAAASPVSGA